METRSSDNNRGVAITILSARKYSIERNFLLLVLPVVQAALPSPTQTPWFVVASPPSFSVDQNRKTRSARRFFTARLTSYDLQIVGYVHSRKLTWKPKKGPIKTTVVLRMAIWVATLVWGSVRNIF